MRKIFLLLALLAASLSAEEKPWFFIQLTDTQLGMFTGNKDFAQDAANFEFAVASVNRLKPRFVIITGDLVNKPGDAAQIAEYKRIAARIDKSIRFYHLPGNHDVDNAPTPATLAAYRRNIGEDWYSFREGDFAGVVINTTIIHTSSAVTDEVAKQKGWLESELAKLKSAGAKQIVVFQHHPWFVMKASEPDGYFNLPLATRQAYLDIFAKGGVRQIFSGHVHKSSVANDAEIEMIVSGPIGMPLSEEGSGMRVGIVRDGRVDHTFYPIGRVPNQIKLD